MSRADDPVWLRTQHTIRKLLHTLGKDALVYAQFALEKEESEPERVKVFCKRPGPDAYVRWVSVRVSTSFGSDPAESSGQTA
jgi:hypothetical protein